MTPGVSLFLVTNFLFSKYYDECDQLFIILIVEVSNQILVFFDSSFLKDEKVRIIKYKMMTNL